MDPYPTRPNRRGAPIAGLALALALLAFTGVARAQHGHLNAGALGQNQGDRLAFANGDAFASSSGYVKELTLATSGRFSGFYSGGITFTALPTSVDNGGPVPNAPAPGSFVMVGIDSVTGPAGASFALWEDGATSPTFEYSVGYDVNTPTSLWALSDASLGAGDAGADPFGHLHGRTFTATELGDYTVGFKLYDLSGNGLNGGPIHTPSESLSISFRAVPEPSMISLLGMGTVAGLWALRRTQPRR